MSRTGVGLGNSLGEYLREQRRGAQLSLRQLAERAQVSNPYLSQVERGLRRPSAQVLTQIARGLQISAEALYVRAGLLEVVAEPDGAVPAAVRSDQTIHERHRRLLLELYTSFRREAAADAARAADAAETAAAAVRAAVVRVIDTTPPDSTPPDSTPPASTPPDSTPPDSTPTDDTGPPTPGTERHTLQPETTKQPETANTRRTA